MGVIWVEGQFKKSTKPVKTVEGSVGGGIVNLEDYVTKEELQIELEKKVDDPQVTDETLILE